MSTIDIRTTQNVTIEYELASLRERAIAAFLDLIIVILLYCLLMIFVRMALRGSVPDSGLFAYFLYGLLPAVGYLLYHFLSEVLADGRSWGKRALGLKVVRLDGEEPSLSDYLVRASFLIVDIILSMGVVAAFMVSSSSRKQRLGDLGSNTTVIRVKSDIRFQLEDILNIDSIDEYEPAYPQVQQLNEKDMLLIKNVITRYRTFSNHAHEDVVNTLVNRLTQILEIPQVPSNKIEFLRTLIRDYIVLTR